MSVNSYLSSLSSLLVINDEERNKITTSISTLSKRLQTYFGSSISAHFVFGSYTRGTILPRKADEESDIDIMVVFNDSVRTGSSY
ncbi:SMODS domain-containing nucleotidyltransferase [Cohnella ginsengisoli]|uniref:SMODS domain-containing nucleotidyltransferase n=1 Tax=Cohnella ginsengisoli TaxID=425004 RepID=UPI003B8A6C5E